VRRDDRAGSGIEASCLATLNATMPRGETLTSTPITMLPSAQAVR
jgi:hypothetical protein